MAKTIYLYKNGDLCTDVSGGWGSFTHEEYGSGRTKVNIFS